MEKSSHDIREEYRYFAFISYSHKDIGWAKWLQRKLESYRLPSQIRKKHIDLPQKIAPVFRDETDLAGPVLEDALQQELKKSQYLIVICSPNSVASEYVNNETEYFLSLGRKDKIIPFVVAGKPFAQDPSLECFPPAIQRITPELLGIDVQEHGKKNAFSRLVATLLRLPADEVVMREQKRDRFRKILASTAIAVLALVLGAVLWYNTEHSAYYNAYTYRHEIPVGLNKLTESQRVKSSDCYRITTLRGKVIRLEAVNSQGIVIESLVSGATTEYPIMEFLYDDAGKLIAVVQCDEAGIEMYRKTLTYPADDRIIVEFSSSYSGESLGLSTDISASLLGNSEENGRSRINRQDNTYNEDGLMVRAMYYWYNTFHPVCDNNGVYGKAYTYNEMGQIASISNLDIDGNVFDCRYGWSTIVMEYDHLGNIVSESYYSVDGSKAIIEKGYHEKRSIFDSNGNVVEIAYINPEGQPCNNDEGISRQIAQYDKQAFVTSVKIFNAQGAPVTNSSGTHESQYAYDKNGRMSRVVLLDQYGAVVGNPTYGFATIERVYDKTGNILEQWLYDAEGQILCVEKNTYADGREVRSVYEDGSGNLISFGGYCICEYSYDQFGNVSRDAYYDTSGDLVLLDQGYALRESDYDEFGNVVELRYYGTDRQPCTIDAGHSIVKFTYTDGLLTSAEYLGTNGEAILTAKGYHAIKMAYNEIGVCIRMENYGTDGNLIVSGAGYAVAEQVCDASGNITELRFLDEQLQPILKDGAYHQIKYRFDSHNNMTHVWYYGTDEALIMQEDGYAALERDFDAYGDSIATRYYGTENEPILYNGQYHEMRYQRDAYRNFTHIWYYGTDGALISVDGWAASEMERDAHGNYLAIRYFGTKNEPILIDGEFHEIRNEYDERENVTRKAYYDTDGNLLITSDGYAAVEFSYDTQGRVCSQCYFGTSNEPILRNGEYHEIRWEYDAEGNEIAAAAYDTNGTLLYEENYSDPS